MLKIHIVIHALRIKIHTPDIKDYYLINNDWERAFS
jgi:hypothetical protein